MEDLLDGLMRDNVAEVKVVLASVALALAGYQLVLIPRSRPAPGDPASRRR